ncbi:alpha/beta hydrolase [Salsipaludibacter albus]|uniref:alpha/beta hydrolase n=1 Tax=Salsipaludibacter albus TaxID=2849650 RepID=UPI001EE3DD03|nr:alpha/beta hydrolase [Salsipaludibacter albus]MBY5163441.1 alpha/beta hydrolase [Salsipaludibacter albus]
MTTAPDTIVLIHGFWVTPRSWEHWITHYEARGYTVLAPAYPGFEVEVEAINADPQFIGDLELHTIVDHLAAIVGQLDTPPILIGHSAGGALTQLLLDRGYGAVGVGLNSAPPEGVRTTPLSQLRSTWAAFKNPANRHRPVPLSAEQWHYAFTNTFDDAESLRLYERYHVPASGRILWSSVLANFMPGPQDAHVDFHRADRPPLLFISGSEDHIMPPSVQRANAKKYDDATVTEVVEYDGQPHLLPASPGWEEIADFALDWAEEHAGAPRAQPA